MCFHNHPSIQTLFSSLIRTLAFSAIALMISIRGASAQCPPPATAFAENQVAASGLNATVGVRDCGEFIITWETPTVAPGDSDILFQRFNPNEVPLGTTFPVSASPEPGSAVHHRASLAMIPLGYVSMAWTGVIRGRFCEILGIR